MTGDDNGTSAALLLEAEELSTHNNKDAIVKAREAYMRALEENDGLTRLKALILMGRCAFMLGRTADAIKWLLECISTAETLDLPEQMANGYNQLGNTCLVMYDYGRSISCYMDALDVARENDIVSLEGSILNNIGALYMTLKDDERAAEYFLLSYEKDKTVSFTSPILLLNLADIFAHKGRFDEADKFLAEARDILERQENLLMTSWLYLTEGEVCHAKGFLDEAITHYRRAIELTRSAGDVHNECEMCFQAGQLLMEAGSLEDALELMSSTYERSSELGSNDIRRKIALQMAICSYDLGRSEEALRCYKLHGDLVLKAESEKIESSRNSVLLQVQQHDMNLERIRLKQLSDELMRKTEELKEAYATMERQAIIDSLTGIRNRRSMDAMIDTSWKKCLTDKQPFTLMLLDLDCFKNYNDFYGHPAGDENLRRVAEALRDVVGDEKLIGRFGGDEFVAVLPETDGESARAIGNAMLERVKNLRILHERNEAASVQTITIGAMSLVPGSEDEQSSVMHMADNALYEGKKQGKNRIVLYCRE